MNAMDLGYDLLLEKPAAETLELFAFMDAALRSKQSGGKPAALR